MTVPSSSRVGRRALAVVNGRAGGGAMHDAFRQVEHDVLDVLGHLDVVFTDRPAHATELAREAAEAGDHDLVIAAGGDGTVNEVVNGLLDSQGRAVRDGLELAILAGGTGGDLRRTLGLQNMDASLAAIGSGRTRLIDVGRLTYRAVDDGEDVDRLFVNIASFGLSGLVDRKVSSYAGLPGRFAYVAATAQSLWSWRNPTVRVAVDGGEGGGHFEAELPVVTVAIANGRYFGGGMCVAPDAEPDDGLFDVTLIGDLRRRDVVALSGSLYNGDHVHHPKVVTRRGVLVTAEADVPVYLDVDGEPVGQLPARFEIAPRALAVAVP